MKTHARVVVTLAVIVLNVAAFCGVAVSPDLVIGLCLLGAFLV